MPEGERSTARRLRDLLPSSFKGSTGLEPVGKSPLNEISCFSLHSLSQSKRYNRFQANTDYSWSCFLNLLSRTWSKIRLCGRSRL